MLCSLYRAQPRELGFSPLSAYSPSPASDSPSRPLNTRPNRDPTRRVHPWTRRVPFFTLLFQLFNSTLDISGCYTYSQYFSEHLRFKLIYKANLTLIGISTEQIPHMSYHKRQFNGSELQTSRPTWYKTRCINLAMLDITCGFRELTLTFEFLVSIRQFLLGIHFD